MTNQFQIEELNRFRHEAHVILPPYETQIFQRAGLQGMVPTGKLRFHLPDLLDDVLEYYDREPLTASMATPSGVIISRDTAWNAKMRIMATPLWEHVIRAGREFLKAARAIMREWKDYGSSKFWLTLIAVVAHDLGKLRCIRPPEYQTDMHPVLGAELLSGIVGNRIGANQEKLIVTAVANHHKTYRECEKGGSWMTAAVIKADRLARDKETNPENIGYFRKALQPDENQ